MLHVTAFRVLPEFRLWLRFSDGVEGTADLSRELIGPIFVPLREPSVFAQAALDPELRTVAWPNGADLAPEFLQSLVLGLPSRAHPL
jgi:Protein of unknown function (DUF2442)